MAKKKAKKTDRYAMSVGGEHDGKRFEAGDVLELPVDHWTVEQGIAVLEGSE